jgi:hypothetical protein
MLIELLNAAGAQGLTIGIRVSPAAAGEYRLVIWIGPRLGERYEWSRRYLVSVPHSEGLNSLAREVLEYCEAHEGWGRPWGKLAPLGHQPPAI